MLQCHLRSNRQPSHLEVYTDGTDAGHRVVCAHICAHRQSSHLAVLSSGSSYKRHSFWSIELCVCIFVRTDSPVIWQSCHLAVYTDGTDAGHRVVCAHICAHRQSSHLAVLSSGSSYKRHSFWSIELCVCIFVRTDSPVIWQSCHLAVYTDGTDAGHRVVCAHICAHRQSSHLAVLSSGSSYKRHSFWSIELCVCIFVRTDSPVIWQSCHLAVYTNGTGGNATPASGTLDTHDCEFRPRPIPGGTR